MEERSFYQYMIKRLFFFIASVACLLTACSDNDSFTTDRSQILSFSQDTVRLDTMFSGVPSVTYTFWVHNRSNDGLRINTVRLERGNQTGFRINVDGTFLNPVAQNLEVRKGDSLRVFVEITSYETHSLEPQLVEDNLLFSLESGVVQKVNLRTYSWDAEMVTDLEVDHDMTIEMEKPLVVYGNGIKVAPNTTLTLRNTTIYFHDNAQLKVEGRLMVENCVLRGDRLDHMFDYLPYDRVSGQWRGIEIVNGAKGCWMTDSEVRNAWDGMTADSTQVVLNNCVIHNSRGYGLYARNSKVQLDYCQLSNAEDDCLALYGCEAVIDHCTLAQFYPFALCGEALLFSPDSKPLLLLCTNTLITGYDEDVFEGVMRDGETIDYHFSNCLIRTPEIKDEEAFEDIIWETPKDEVQGKDHFLLFDDSDFIYDFSIVSTSSAYERAIGRAFHIEEDDDEE
jgi:hypothetical protein